MKKLILIVDDSVDSQELLTTLFESLGYKVHYVSNGAEALALLFQLSLSGIMPDLILLDYQMPVMSGAEFRARQLERAELKDIPVIVMTGDPSEDIFLMMKNPQALLSKPINIQKLVQTIQ